MHRNTVKKKSVFSRLGPLKSRENDRTSEEPQASHRTTEKLCSTKDSSVGRSSKSEQLEPQASHGRTEKLCSTKDSNGGKSSKSEQLDKEDEKRAIFVKRDLER